MAEGSRDFWRVSFELLPLSNSHVRFMKEPEVKRVLTSMMRIIKRFCTKTTNWHATKKNGLDSVPFTPRNLDNVLKWSAQYDSFAQLDVHRSGYHFHLFTLDDQDERFGVDLHLGGSEDRHQDGTMAFRVGTSWENLFLKADRYQFLAELLEHFNLNTITLDTSGAGVRWIGHANYFSKLNYGDFFVYIKKHFKIVQETPAGILVEFCKINKKNRTVDVLQLPHVKKLKDMIAEQHFARVHARYS
jgi:hypothetical protein